MGNQSPSQSPRASIPPATSDLQRESDLPVPSPGGPGLQDAPPDFHDEPFDVAIAEYEDFWQAAQESSEADDKSEQMRRFAAPILTEIEILREYLSHNPTTEAAIVLAVDLGRRLGNSKWRFGAGDRIRIGEKVRRGGQKGGGARKEPALLEQLELASRVDAYLTNHPGAPRRQIAMNLLPSTERTDKNAIDAMTKRIARLKK